jgi:predicted O-linked N-acetylglucosamine transferase (SPINDLY family)
LDVNVPTKPDPRLDRAFDLYEAGDLDGAIDLCQAVLRLDDRHYGALYLLGSVLGEKKKLDDAAAALARAIAVDPSRPLAHFNLATVLRGMGRHAEALASLERARAAKPDLAYLLGDIWQVRQHLCDWSEFTTASDRIREAIAAGECAASPFDALASTRSDAHNRKAAEIYVASEFQEIPRPAAFARVARGDKIRLGYFSSDLRDHATARLMAGVFERHDKTRFEVSAFSFGPSSASDEMRRRLTAAFDRFFDVGDRSDQQIADLARSLGIDIAIDLNGFTELHRFGIFAHRAAPIQVSYLGFPGTTGAPFIDYLIADPVVVPESQRVHFSERIVRLPNTYHPCDRTRETAEETPSRASLSLPESGFVFCCFNNSYKIMPDVFDSWMRILRRTPGSVLWLLRDSEPAAQNLRREAEARGIDPNRLAFAGRMPIAQHLARHRQADLFLDTLPYNAHTTASDALWAGLPVLTRIGETFAGRVAASELTAIGLPEMIARSQAEYEAMAVDLASNPDNLAAMKAKLANNRLTTPLFDTEGFTRDLERAFAAMCARHRLGLPPEDIDLTTS